MSNTDQHDSKRRRTTDSEDRKTDKLDKPSPAGREGWGEIESDPAVFSHIIKELGVKGVSVREIYSLDTDALALLPRPVYGVIFLFKWREDEEGADSRFKAGANMWFANQTVDNACATFALINIINNLDDVELGSHLQQFREFTMSFTPALRGDALANWQFAKRIHNSFTREMDHLNSDSYLKEQVQVSAKQSRKRSIETETDTAAHHFIAFMPIKGVIWKMDGLEWQPRSLGKVVGDNWLDNIQADLQIRMSRHADSEHEFAILGLVKDPLYDFIERLASNVKTLQDLRARGIRVPCCDEGHDQTCGAILTDDPKYALTGRDIARAENDVLLGQLESDRPEDLRRLAESLHLTQRKLRSSVLEELTVQKQRDAEIERRRHDCGHAMRRWLSYLAQNGMVREVDAVTS